MKYQVIFAICFSLLTFHFSLTFGQSIITTVGGENIGNNVTGTDFGINPYSVVPDNMGNLYIADASNHLVHELTSSGILTVVAGTGSYGYTGDGGYATNAQFIYPCAVALDNAGNLYVVDNSGQCVREINLASGLITTVAGNGNWGYNGDNIPATNAYLYNPLGLAIDSVNNLYISDYSNNRIRKVTALTGIITTITGTDSTGYNHDSIPADSAWLHSPAGITLDKQGNIYFVDQSNCRIREIKASNDTIYTLSGGRAGFSGDGGPAAKAQFWYPLGIAVDASGNVYISDTYDNRIREITIANDTINTICGTGSGNFSGDGGPASLAELFQPHYLNFDASGNLYIADLANERIRVIYSANNTINTLAGDGLQGYNGNNVPATTSQLSYPTDIAIDTGGNIYVADNGNNMVREIEASSGNILKIAGDGLAGFSGDGGPAGKAEMNGVDGIAINDTGNLFLADEYNNRIREVKVATNTIITSVGNGHAGFSGDGGNATSAELFYPVAVAFDPKGDMFIADMINNRIREVDYHYHHIKTIAGNGYNANNGGGYSGDGGPAVDAELNQPQGVATDNAGNVYIADTWNDRIRKVNSSGIITTIAGNGNWNYTGDGGPATAAQLGIPTSVYLDPAGNVYFADFYNNVVRMVNVWDSTISTVAGNGTQSYSGDGGYATSAELDLAHGVKIDNAGNLVVADYGNNRIRQITGVTGIKSISNKGSMMIYPNPSTDVVNIMLSGFNSDHATLDVMDVSGKIVIEKEVTKLYLATPVSVNISGLADGMYLLTLKSNTQRLTAKIVKN